jgi:diaminopimelate epimerase
MQALSFRKYQALANDFIFIDNKAFHSTSLIPDICDRHLGIGADGLVVYSQSSSKDAFDFSWEFFNSDGSKAKMCGNAARCATLLFCELLNKNECQFQAEGQVVQGKKLTKTEAEVRLKAAKRLESPNELVWIDSNVPHLIVPVKDEPIYEQMIETAKKHREDPRFGSEGTNVTFVKVRATDLQVFSFERGVEDITQACGTGAIAAAYYYMLTKQQDEANVLVQMPGGQLRVTVNDSCTLLSGEAKHVFSGQLNLESL